MARGICLYLFCTLAFAFIAKNSLVVCQDHNHEGEKDTKNETAVFANILKQIAVLQEIKDNLTEVENTVLDVVNADSKEFPLDGGPETEISSDTDKVRSKRTLGVMSRFFCSVFYRNSPSNCPFGQRSQPETGYQTDAGISTSNDDFWLNYLGTGNNGTNGTDGDAVFTPTTQPPYVEPTTAEPTGVFANIFRKEWYRRRFRSMFPRLYTLFGGRAESEDAINTTPRPSLWARTLKRFQRLRAGYRGFRAGWRGDTNEDGTPKSQGGAGGLDISQLLANVDLSALLNNFRQ